VSSCFAPLYPREGPDDIAMGGAGPALILAGSIITEAAPPFAFFEGEHHGSRLRICSRRIQWPPSTDGQVRRTPTLFISIVRGAHLPKTAEGGAASAVIVQTIKTINVGQPPLSRATHNVGSENDLFFWRLPE
jgi:hypothetical protein